MQEGKRGETLNILGIAGSLRRASFNRALLRAAQELAPQGMEIEIFDRVGELPLYNPDVEAMGAPEPVAALKLAISRAHGLLIATPEYNYSIPAPLKNALDWASRPPAETPLRGKPIAIMGAAVGAVGTARAQLALRQSLVFTQSHVMPAPELLLGRAPEKFDADLRLIDEQSRQFLRQHLERFASYVKRFTD